MASYQFLPIAYFQNQFVPFEQANLSIATHALHYGTAALGGLRIYALPDQPGKFALFRLDRHCQRLSHSARFLHFDLPADKIASILLETVRQNPIQTSAYLRPLVYTSDLGISPRLHDIEKSFLVYGIELGDYLPPDGITCRISSWTRQEDRAMPLRGKLSASYITSSLAKTEAVHSGFDEAILLTSRGKVSEGSGSNLFIVRNGTLITPTVEQDNLEGITRDSVMILARDLGITVVEREVDKSELFIADEVFLTGTAAKIASIKRIENYPLPSERPLTEQLRQVFNTITAGRNPNYADWLTVVA
ncbi:MAG: branched-chain amino acid transaminase [Cyanobacteria bacterium J06635_15]